VLSVTPHIVGNSKLPNASEMEYWSGTESTLRSGQLVLKPLGTVSLGNTSSTGVVPAATGMTPLAPPPIPRTPPMVAVPRIPANDSNKDGLPTQPTVLSWQGPSQAKVGNKITLRLNAQSTLGIKALGFHVVYDPAVLKAIDIVEGEALKRNNAQSTFTTNIDQASGDMAVDMSGTGASGYASVATMAFEVLSAVPESTVTVSSVVASGTNGEALTPTSPMPHVIVFRQ
jgi:general secretion pathway protein D